MAVALFTEMSHPHGDPNTGPSPARFISMLNDRDQPCGLKYDTNNNDLLCSNDETDDIGLLLVICVAPEPHHQLTNVGFCFTRLLPF